MEEDPFAAYRDPNRASALLVDNSEHQELAQVYGHLLEALTHRGITLRTPAPSVDVAVEKINTNEYIILDGERVGDRYRPDVTAITVFIKSNSKFASSVGDFKKLIPIPRDKLPRAVNYLFVTKAAPKTHVAKYVATFKKEHKERGVYHIEFAPYDAFLLNVTKHVSVPPHLLITEKEVDEYCEKHYLSKSALPIIDKHDAQAIWLGLMPGMHVVLLFYTDTAGTSWDLRVCK